MLDSYTPWASSCRMARSADLVVLSADHGDGCGTELFRAVCKMDVEGIVAKLKETTWVKLHCCPKQPQN